MDSAEKANKSSQEIIGYVITVEINSERNMSDEKWIKLMEYGRKLGCHQMPERSFFWKGYQFPVCARCTGVLLSTIIATIVFFRYKLPVKVCFALSSVMLIDWVIQYLGIKESTNKRRLITGLIGGFGYTMLHLHICIFVLRRIKLLIIT